MVAMTLCDNPGTLVNSLATYRIGRRFSPALAVGESDRQTDSGLPLLLFENTPGERTPNYFIIVCYSFYKQPRRSITELLVTSFPQSPPLPHSSASPLPAVTDDRRHPRLRTL